MLPMVQPSAEMPDSVTIYEVAPRDGLQNESKVIPVDVKREFVQRLFRAGLNTVELTSFVAPSWVPQLADAEQLFEGLGASSVGRHRPVLVPNEKGLDRALQHGVQAIAVFASATERFARTNLNGSISETLSRLAPVVRRARNANLWIRGYVSMCFGDPWEGPVPVEQVVDTCVRLMELGCDQLALGDTIGVATPGHVETLLTKLKNAGIGPERIGVHFHDTYGQALSNTLTAIRRGVTTVDSSAGGLGGCPYAKSATGNLATEDLVWALQGLGIHHGVDLKSLVDTSVWMASKLDKPSPSLVVKALVG